MTCHLAQIEAVFPTLDNRNIYLARLLRQVFLAVPTLRQQFEHRFNIGLRRMQQQRQVVNARHHFQHVVMKISFFRQHPNALLARQRHRQQKFKHYRSFT